MLRPESVDLVHTLFSMNKVGLRVEWAEPEALREVHMSMPSIHITSELSRRLETAHPDQNLNV